MEHSRVVVDRHRAQLDHPEVIASSSGTQLPEKSRTRRIQPHRERRKRQHGGEQHDGDERAADIHRSLRHHIAVRDLAFTAIACQSSDNQRAERYRFADQERNRHMKDRIGNRQYQHRTRSNQSTQPCQGEPGWLATCHQNLSDKERRCGQHYTRGRQTCDESGRLKVLPECDRYQSRPDEGADEAADDRKRRPGDTESPGP